MRLYTQTRNLVYSLVIQRLKCIHLNMVSCLCSYLVAAMGLQFLWSFGLATLDAYALLIKRGLRNPILVSLFVVGDWVSTPLPSV